MFPSNLRERVIVICTFALGSTPKALNTLAKNNFPIDNYYSFNLGFIFKKKVLEDLTAK